MKNPPMLSALLLTACGSNPPVPDWQMNAHDSLQRASAAYLSGDARVEAAQYQRARKALASTGKVDLIIRAELTRCAARVASLVFDDCPGYDALSRDASPADRAYAAYLAGRPADAALLPPQHQAVAAATSDAAAASAVQAIADPLARLVASGVVLRTGKASPAILETAADTASAQGWRRPLLAWLGAQALRADQAGDTATSERLKRRMALITN